jgi:putative ABC transport system ATP-binding protein
MGRRGMMLDAQPIVEVDAVTKTYRTGSVSVGALRGVSFTLGAGQMLALMGPSGSGKTTLLNILAGLDQPTSGEVRVAGERVSALDADKATVFRRRTIGFVFQFFNLLPTMTARDNVALPLLADRVALPEIANRTDAALAAVGLGHRANHRPSELSGGEMQRVAIARALVMEPKVLLADEPTGNLDTTTGEGVLHLLRQAVTQYALSVIMVTHSHLAAASADRLILLSDGQITDDIETRSEGRSAVTLASVKRPRP